MNNYDILAKYYDSIMGDRSDVAVIIEKQIAEYNPQAKTILELGCGTGAVLSLLDDTYEKTGIDQSIKMLKIAQQKLPNSHFLQHTIAGFELNQTFDVIICVFDTINHLANFSQWQKLFASTKRHLATNGIFIFDMNTTGRMQMLTVLPNYIQEFENKTMEMTILPIKNNEVEWNLIIQDPSPDGLIEVYEEHVREAAFPLQQVRTELINQGFEILTSFDSNNNQPSDHSDRIYFVCR